MSSVHHGTYPLPRNSLGNVSKNSVKEIDRFAKSLASYPNLFADGRFRRQPRRPDIKLVAEKAGTKRIVSAGDGGGPSSGEVQESKRKKKPLKFDPDTGRIKIHINDTRKKSSEETPWFLPKEDLFRINIIGPSACGKTVMMLNIIFKMGVPWEVLDLIGTSTHQEVYKKLCEHSFGYTVDELGDLAIYDKKPPKKEDRPEKEKEKKDPADDLNEENTSKYVDGTSNRKRVFRPVENNQILKAPKRGKGKSKFSHEIPDFVGRILQYEETESSARAHLKAKGGDVTAKKKGKTQEEKEKNKDTKPPPGTVEIREWNEDKGAPSISQLSPNVSHMAICDDMSKAQAERVANGIPRARHNRVKVIMLNQNYFNIDRKLVRTNCPYLILFKPNEKDLINLYVDKLSRYSKHLTLQEFVSWATEHTEPKHENDYPYMILDESNRLSKQISMGTDYTPVGLLRSALNELHIFSYHKRIQFVLDDWVKDTGALREGIKSAFQNAPLPAADEQHTLESQRRGRRSQMI